MSDDGAWAAGLLIDEAWASYTAGRYQTALAAAGRAVEAAENLDNLVLLVRALEIEADALRLSGDPAAALTRYTKIIGLAQDPSTARHLDAPLATRAVAVSYWNWVDCAQYVTGIPVEELFRVLDGGERYLATTGHMDWRPAILLERALVHDRLGHLDEAIAVEQEAITLAEQRQADTPGYTLNAHRYTFGQLLRHAGRPADAVPLYHALLDDPSATLWDKHAGHDGLASCALAAGDPQTAVNEARIAIQMSEMLGDDALCTSLEALTLGYLGIGELDTARDTMTRYLEASERIGGHLRPYYAMRTAVDVALARRELVEADRLLDKFEEHASALDRSTSATSTQYGGEVTQRRSRLADLRAEAEGTHAEADG